MLFSKSAALIALTVGGLSNTGLPPFDPVQDFAPRAVSFDDRPGKGFEWNKQLPCGANRASVTVKFDKAYPNDHTAPVAKVWLHLGGKGDPSEEWVAAVLRAPMDPSKLDALAWLEKVTDSASKSPGGYGWADMSRPYHLDFSWTPDGVVRVNFNGEYVKQVTTDKPINGIGVGGSWSKNEFIDLKVGREGAPDPACKLQLIANSAPSPTQAVVP